jgi:hypothetical protein
MKDKKNVIALLWVALVIVIIYTFIAFRVTRPEIQFLTKWTFIFMAILSNEFLLCFGVFKGR